MRFPAGVLLLVVGVACTGSTDGAVTTPPSDRSDQTAGSALPEDSVSQALPEVVCWLASPSDGSAGITFTDATDAYGLVAPLTGMHGHAAAWGDLAGTGDLGLVVGTFANRPIENYELRGATGPSPDRLFTLADTFDSVEGFPDMFGRTSGAVIADFDNDGDEDVVLSRNMRSRERGDVPTQVFRNDGASLTALDLDLGRMFSGRSIGVLDFNRDGLLDLFIVEDRFASERSSVLLENLGDLEFRDVTSDRGIPAGVHGLGLATSDLNGDGFTDLFVGGSNRMFLGGPNQFDEVDSATFQWEAFGDEDDVAGAAIADLNRDGLPDLVVGHHYNSTLSAGVAVPIRVYLNRGNDSTGFPMFEDVTNAAGLIGLPTKAPHVEIADFDNDGWPDILTTASADDGTAPAVFRHLGVDEAGLPRFEAPAGLGSPQYWVTGPTADVDRDGRLDLLLVEWEPSLPSLLLVNETASGNWIEVGVGPESGQPAVGSLVEIWTAGHLDESDHLLGSREIVASQGYTAGNLQVVHFGLGQVDRVDLSVTYPDGTSFDVVEMASNANIRVPEGC